MKEDESPRNLVDICEVEDFRVVINENKYCSIAMNKKIECPMQRGYKDQNGLYPCMNIRDDYEVSDDQIMS